jgi:anti-sigma B factor antagonist
MKEDTIIRDQGAMSSRRRPYSGRLAKTSTQAIGWFVNLERERGSRQKNLCWPQRSTSMQLKVTTRTKDGVLVVDSSGRIVFGEESSLLRETVKQAVTENNRIVLNLGEVNYIDSGGLGTLVALRITAQNAGGTIKLTNLTKRVGDVLQVTKLLTVFDVYNSEAEAIESFRAAA